MHVSQRTVPAHIEEKVFRCVCGAWTMQDRECPVCQLITTRYRYPV
jgi:hypothetical protein